jgi:O-antigen/teichoic acid export membrane protein
MYTENIIIACVAYSIAITLAIPLYLMLKHRIKSRWFKYFHFGNIPLLLFALVTGTLALFADGFELFILTIVASGACLIGTFANIIVSSLLYHFLKRDGNKPNGSK